MRATSQGLTPQWTPHYPCQIPSFLSVSFSYYKVGTKRVLTLSDGWEVPMMSSYMLRQCLPHTKHSTQACGHCKATGLPCSPSAFSSSGCVRGVSTPSIPNSGPLGRTWPAPNVSFFPIPGVDAAPLRVNACPVVWPEVSSGSD